MDFYPSEYAEDLTWHMVVQPGGDLPAARGQSSMVVMGEKLYVFGGVTSYMTGKSLNTTHEFSTRRESWQAVSVKGATIGERNSHTATLCADTCAAGRDGKPRMYVFGGWGLRPCRVGKGECLTHLNDLYALELNDMKWEEVDVNSEQPRPYGRKSHTATFVGTRLFVFGGHAWVPDHDADNEYGMTSKAVGDLWYIDLAGAGRSPWSTAYTTGDAPCAREGHGAAYLHDRWLVIHGGYAMGRGARGSLYLQDTYVLDTHAEPMVWSQPPLTGKLPEGRSFHSLVLLDGEIFAWGGSARSASSTTSTSSASSTTTRAPRAASPPACRCRRGTTTPSTRGTWWWRRSCEALGVRVRC